MLRMLLYVGLGGFAGTVSRYAISYYTQKWISSPFPYATFAVNLIGSFLIGLLFALSARSSIDENTRIILATGFCGGFTTFSAFSMECVTLLKNGNYGTVLIYVSASVVLGLAAAYIGMRVVRGG